MKAIEREESGSKGVVILIPLTETQKAQGQMLRYSEASWYTTVVTADVPVFSRGNVHH